MPFKHSLLVLSGLLFVSLGTTTTVMAACPSLDTTVFSCKTSNGKQVDICDAGKNLSYSFGKPGKPELAFSLPKSKAYKYLWDGMTTSEWNEVYIPRGNTTYVAYQAFHRKERRSEHGLNVFINQKQVANIRCASNIQENIESINLLQISNDERL